MTDTPQETREPPQPAPQGLVGTRPEAEAPRARSHADGADGKATPAGRARGQASDSGPGPAPRR
jgi:hypothetical protein